MRILLVDDDTFFTDLISSSLAEMGLDDLTIAHSAEDALDLIESQRLPFDCYLLDIMLGGMDGIELCQQLRARRASQAAPIIMITASTDSPLMARAFDAGATDFLRKPLDHVEVVGRIRTAMMLVETTRNEKRGRHALRALISYSSDFNLIDLSERVCFPDINSMVDYYQIENRLLKMQDGLFQMHLFRVRVRNFSTLNKRTERAHVLQQLHAISATISQAVSAQNFMLSYLGQGSFVCCIIGRHSMVPDLFQAKLRHSAQDALSNVPSCKGVDVVLDVSEVSTKRILSRTAALSLLSRELEMVSSGQPPMLPEVRAIEERIFTAIDEHEHKLLASH
ncbi:PleD family two-component system response regulator [Aquicoccus sp. G2-2]|jgi:CheY-like chemotaxis protein|uniref:response regulator n=1 Tax=Aquicoccus sp. G2-2 TaxID=3092120 RepID=UPI002ADF9AE9|nr:response regulator [Aquicoccus sp. G2-2]MEA1113943.1 response regulator [Aquicoccus sp. G2-2]